MLPEIAEKLKALEEKYQASGQDMVSYLEGLLHADYLTYWDYIHLETLLTLQQPRTPFPDEQVFIMYHQISELYLKLILHEMAQLAEAGDNCTVSLFLQKLERINMYFESMTHSFSTMHKGMELDQFNKFRMALLPASGFQSVQFRLMEIASTRLVNLTHAPDKGQPAIAATDLDTLFTQLYWYKGATEMKSKKQTLTLKLFKQKFGHKMLNLAKERQHTNLESLFDKLAFENGHQQRTVTEEMRRYDYTANVAWKNMHLRAAMQYLRKGNDEAIAATGGTNWQKYLPPRLQRRMFFPDLWNDEEKENWGTFDPFDKN